MNQFKPHDDLYHPKIVASQIRKDFHKENTAPHPIIPQNITSYPAAWDKHKMKRWQSLHQMSETMLSNRQYVLVCSVIMSLFMFFVVVIMLLKLALQILFK